MYMPMDSLNPKDHVPYACVRTFLLCVNPNHAFIQKTLHICIHSVFLQEGQLLKAVTCSMSTLHIELDVHVT